MTSPYLTRFPASFDPSSFPSTIRYRTHIPESRPTSDWWLGSESPLIYVTFGTVLGYISIAADVFNTVLKVFSNLPETRVLLTTGRQFDRSKMGPIPGNVRVEPWIDQADVVSAANLVLCHGGSGTVYGALAAGVPLVIVPVFADQFDNGRRVSDAGAGRIVENPREASSSARRLIGDQDVARITQAVEEVLTEPSYRQEASRIADEMAAPPTVDEVLGALLS